jgi:hypothetical protein
MTTDDDMRTLHDDLHELADAVAPASASTARDRARRGIARRARNRRAAVGAGAAVVLIAATVFFAVDRDTKDSQRPIGTTTPSVTSAPTTTSTTTTTVPGSPILGTIPAVSDLPAATASYAKTFGWGTGDDQVAFHTPQGEGVSGGPIAFDADGAGNITILDQSNSRVVHFERVASPAQHIALADPGVSAAVFDDNNRVVVANSELAVFSFWPRGQKEDAWDPLGSIGRLEVDAGTVYEVHDNTRLPRLRFDGSRYVPVANPTLIPTAVQVDVVSDRHIAAMTATASGQQYRIATADSILGLHEVKQYPFGPLVFVLAFEQSNTDQPDTYVIGRIDRDGNALYQTVHASWGYLVNGPQFVLNGLGVAVMDSTTTGGVTVSYYPFD